MSTSSTDNMRAAGWHLVMCGINHKTSQLQQRERLQIGRESVASAHADLASLPGVQEAIIVSTCNRIEFYMVARRKDDPFDIAATFYLRLRDLDITSLREDFYVAKGKHAAGHLFRVAAGIDSMVLGETQILGQIKDAYSSACAVKVAGKIMHRLFHQAFRVGKQVRTVTDMGKGSCSVSTAAVGLLKSHLDAEARPAVLFVGTSKMIALAASSWNRLHHRRLMFANRTQAASKELAAKYGASHYSLDDLPSLLAEADIVISCTGSPEPIITREMLQAHLDACPSHKLMIMDMAVPRDVEFDKNGHPDLTIFDLDDVQQYVKEQQSIRAAAIPDAERLVDERLGEFAYWYDHVRNELTFARLMEDFESVRREDLASLLRDLPEDVRTKVDEQTSRLVQKLAQMKTNTGAGSSPDTE
ncbi:MAG: glutamyl-tRNA reductase [Gammaproteobacteria bacterium]|nr:glutamyl-tRNA reductase [Gammaproteobacteria bacterium]